MPVYSFFTIKSSGQGVYKEKGSKFLSFAYHVETEGEIKERIASLKSEYFDASHHCFAWILGPERNLYRTFDDGEPNHSAGDPIMGQLRAKNLTNVLIVVVRYFGGTKLGVSGLITAYKTAAEVALNNSVVAEQEVMQRARIVYDYSITADVMRMVKDYEITIVSQEFNDQSELVGDVPLKYLAKFKEKVKLLMDLGLPVRTEELG